MTRIVGKLKLYREIFGRRGLWLPIKTKLARQPKEVQFLPRGLTQPISLRLKSSDLATYKKIFIDLEYDFPLAKSPSVIVDAGANVGFASVFFARKYPNARILAIEPETSNFALLKKNVQEYPNVIPIGAALWTDNKMINLVDPGIGHWGFRAEESIISQGPTAKVQGMTIDHLMRTYAIDYIDVLKMDVEGGEKAIFENAPPWISNIGVIMIELHDHIRCGCSRNFYLATRDFDFESRKGENVCLMRKSYVAATPEGNSDL